MTNIVFNTTKELGDITESEMLEIAYNLNSIEPSAGGVMPESAAEWANGFMGSLGGFSVFMVLTVASVALILAAPTLIKEFRNFWNKPKTIRN